MSDIVDRFIYLALFAAGIATLIYVFTTPGAQLGPSVAGGYVTTHALTRLVGR